MKFKEICRWATVLLLGGGGVCALGMGLWDMVRHFERGWGLLLFEGLFLIIFSTLPLAIANFAYRRQYRRIAKLVLGVFAFFLVGILSHWFRKLGGSPFIRRPDPATPWVDLLGMVLVFAPLVLPVWFYKGGVRMIERWLPADPLSEEEIAWVSMWNHRVWPVQRKMLKFGLYMTAALLWIAGLVFIGALVRMWIVTDAPVGTADPLAWMGDPFEVGFLMLVTSLGIFLTSLLVRSGLHQQLRLSAGKNAWAAEQAGGQV